jgi:hypothetical protein
MVFVKAKVKRGTIIKVSNKFCARYEARFAARVNNGPRAHQTSSTISTETFSVVNRSELGVNNPPQLAPRLKKE